MSDTAGDNAKYKWTPESTALLVSVWSDRQVQKQLEYAPRPQVIWENVARYMRKKGYNVSAKHCRSRMKQVLVCYREAKRAGTRSGVEQYYEIIDRVLKNKRLEHTNGIGVDTVGEYARGGLRRTSDRLGRFLSGHPRCKFLQTPASEGVENGANILIL